MIKDFFLAYFAKLISRRRRIKNKVNKESYKITDKGRGVC